MQLSRYLKSYSCPDRPGHQFLYSTRRGSLVRVNASLFAAIREGRIDADKAAALGRLGILVVDPAAERDEMKNILNRTDGRNGKYNVTAVLNLDCNLACPYCYEDSFRGRHYMTEETARLLVATIQRQITEQGTAIHIDFYGGEPLLSIPLLQLIATSVARAASIGSVKFTFDLFTNGTLLTRAVAEELVPLGLRAARLTLDGPKEIHDRQRPFVSGKGSFDQIVANIKAVWNLVAIQTGGNFSPDIWREFPRLLDQLLAEGVTPDMLDLVSFSPILPKATKSAGPHFSGCCLTGNEPWLLAAAPYLMEETLKRGFRTPRIKMGACVVEFDNEIVVNYDGSLYKCPVLMGWPELSVGTLADGVDDYFQSHSISRWQNDECLECSYLPLCFGGCRYLSLQRTGTMDQVDCRREFYDATLEKMILLERRYRNQKGRSPVNSEMRTSVHALNGLHREGKGFAEQMKTEGNGCQCGAGQGSEPCLLCRGDEGAVFWCANCARLVNEKRCPLCGMKTRKQQR